MIWSYLVFSGVTSGLLICAVVLGRDGFRHGHFIAVIFGLTMVQLMKTCGLHMQADKDLYYYWLYPQNAATSLIAAGLFAGTMTSEASKHWRNLAYGPATLFFLLWPVWMIDATLRTRQNWMALQTFSNGLLVAASLIAFVRLRWLSQVNAQRQRYLRVARWLYSITLLLSLTALAFYLLTHMGLLPVESKPQIPVRFVVQSFLLHTILAIMIIKPKLLQMVGFAHNARYENSHLTQIDTADLAQALMALLRDEKPYHEPDFTKARLAELLDITQHQLGELLNVHLGKSFSELTNSLRSADLAEAIKANSEQTLLELGLALGFNSKSAMNLNFRRQTGVTPTAFASLDRARQKQIIRQLRSFLNTTD